MQNRKQFLQTAAALSLGSIAFSNTAFASLLKGKKYPPAGLQLFTFFNEIDADVPGTLKKIAAVGYKEIESAFSKKGGFYGMKPKDFAAMLKDMGMSWKSHHVLGAPFKLPPGAKMPVDADGKPIAIPPMRNLKDNMQPLVDEAAEGGVEYLVCASTPIATLEDVKTSIEVLNKTDEACKKAGIGFAYHNHDREFYAVEGQIPYELFLTQTKMKMELDLAWATKAGKDPPWGEEPALRAAVRRLRDGGETVLAMLPGHEFEAQAFACDRELILVNGHWVLRALGAASPS